MCRPRVAFLILFLVSALRADGHLVPVTRAAAAEQDASERLIQDGVYTAAQAERGKAAYVQHCSTCHKPDLNGGAAIGAGQAPPLKGRKFLQHWEQVALGDVFRKMRDEMPPNEADLVTDAVKVDILSYILQANDMPPGREELKTSLGVLDSIAMSNDAAVANFTMVRVVGCLTRGQTGWMLTNATAPVKTRDEATSVTSSAVNTPLGAKTFQLVSVNVSAPLTPEGHNGHKMEARGLFYQDSTDARLNLTSLQMVAVNCEN